MLKGSYALGILYKNEPDRIYAIRKESPLILGKCNHGSLLASDIPAILPHTNQVFFLENEELAILKKDKISIQNLSGEIIHKEPFTVDWTVESAQKTGYEHFMQKEMAEQSEAVKKTLNYYLTENKIQLPVSPDFLSSFQRIQIVACGSAYHVGILGKYMLEEYTFLPTEAEIASEFRYRQGQIGKDPLFVAVSQSGETADTLAALRKAKEKGAFCLAIVNVVGSSLAREADCVLYTMAGPEISVATTKAYSAQLAVFYLLTLAFAKAQKTMEDAIFQEAIRQLHELPSAIAKVQQELFHWEEYGKQFHKAKQVFFIGRGYDFGVGLEGALKLKEISYLPSEAYAAGELKHGPISLIENGTPVIALATDEKLFDKTLSNIREVKSRGGNVLLITTEDILSQGMPADEIYRLPKFLPLFMPSLSVLPLQGIAYHIAKCRGCDIDKPRNLAKPVTVE